MSDLSIATQELFAATFAYQVGLRKPISAMLLEERRVAARGGTYITYDLVKDDAEDEAQAYAVNEGLTVAQSEFLGQAKFKWKYLQMPIKYTVDDEIQNHLATSEVKRHDLVKLIVERGQDGIRKKLDTLFHTISSTDAGKNFQSIYDAQDHSRLYGALTSNTTTVSYWNGASLDGTWTDRNTAMALSLGNLRLLKMIVKRYREPGEKLYGFLPEALFSKLQGILEGSVTYKAEGKMLKYGFDAFEAYGIEFVCDSYMTLNSQTAYMTILNPATWELRLHPERTFKVSDFVHQATIAGGADEHVARIFLAGNLCCKQPNANVWKSNVS